MATPNRDVTDAAVGALPGAVNSMALSLNENPVSATAYGSVRAGLRDRLG